MNSRIAGTGRALPERIVSNRELASMVDTSDAWITERTGVRERRVLEPGLVTSDLAAQAGANACRAAGVRPAEIDCIIVATVTPDAPLPATAAYVQRKLGAKAGGAAFDLAAACAGFVYGLAVADGFIAKGMFQHVLVVGVEVLSRIVDWQDRSTCVLFGDGAGAVVLVPESGSRGVLSTHLFADGAHADILHVPAGGSRAPASAQTIEQRQHYVKMNGREVYQHAVRNMTAAARTALEANGLTAADVAWIVTHQANLRIVQGVAERMDLPIERFFINLQRYGNTSSASLPIALDELVEQGRVERDDVLLLVALGAGLAWGAAVIRW